jgi:WD40 repeat protein
VHRNGNVINYKWYSQGLNRIPFQCAIEKEHKLDRIAKLKYDPVEYYDPSLDLDNFPLEVICSGQYLLIGGICEGKLVQLESESGSLFETYKHHHEPITCIRSDSKDNFVITGDSSGDVILWRIASQSRLVFSHRFSDHSLKINSIFISYELRSFATCSDDGSIQLYNIITGKRLRAYFHPELKPISNILITTCPLAVIIMFCSR